MAHRVTAKHLHIMLTLSAICSVLTASHTARLANSINCEDSQDQSTELPRSGFSREPSGKER